MVYRGVATFNRSVCRSLGAFEIALGNRIATVIFTTDTIQGTGTGFRVNFSSYGMSHSCVVTSFVFVLYTNLYKIIAKMDQLITQTHQLLEFHCIDAVESWFLNR